MLRLRQTIMTHDHAAEHPKNVFRIASLALSVCVVFEPGDLIAMGAPSGVAVGQPNAAELYLQPGDDMVISFEGLMSP